MPFTDVQIVNLGLLRIGISRGISSLTENTAEARAANLLFAPMREKVLADFPWPFAQKYDDLALVATDPNTQWRYSYRTPADALKVRRLIPSAASGIAGADLISWHKANRVDTYPFAVAHDVTGPLIFTDLESAAVHYTVRFENPAHFAPEFGNALAWCLAAELVVPLSVSATRLEELQAYYRQALAEARAAAGNEGNDAEQCGEFVAGRW